MTADDAAVAECNIKGVCVWNGSSCRCFDIATECNLVLMLIYLALLGNDGQIISVALARPQLRQCECALVFVRVCIYIL